MICERCGEHEAELKVSRVDRDRVHSLNLCATCGRRGLTDSWWLQEDNEPAESARPGRERERDRAVKEVRERGED